MKEPRSESLEGLELAIGDLEVSLRQSLDEHLDTFDIALNDMVREMKEQNKISKGIVAVLLLIASTQVKETEKCFSEALAMVERSIKL